MLSKYLKHKKGIALVEVVAALGIAVVVITSLVSLAIFTMRSSLRNKLLLEGTKHANKEMELVRAYRDSVSWEDFTSDMSGCGGGCYINDISGLSVGGGTVTYGEGLEAVTRYFTAAVGGGEESVDITATAEWQIGGEDKSTNIYTTLTNWRNK